MKQGSQFVRALSFASGDWRLPVAAYSVTLITELSSSASKLSQSAL
jgi:hypothetical protein